MTAECIICQLTLQSLRCIIASDQFMFGPMTSEEKLLQSNGLMTLPSSLTISQ